MAEKIQNTCNAKMAQVLDIMFILRDGAHKYLAISQFINPEFTFEISVSFFEMTVNYEAFGPSVC